jgi:plasmid stabilization system protein ParE
MRYSVLIEPSAKEDLLNIFKYISKNDSTSKATTFLRQLQRQINTLDNMPQRCRASLYFNDGKTKDMIYKGYTISFHIAQSNVHIVAIFRQKNY